MQTKQYTKCNKPAIINNDKKRKYRYSLKGLYTDLFSGMKSSSKKRGHPAPAFTKNELIQWLNGTHNFTSLYTQWVLSGYTRKLKPSIDRLDNTKSYTFNNMQVITWINNTIKG